MNTVWVVLAFLPIVSLIIISLLRSIQTAAIVSLVITTILFFVWQAPLPHFFAALVVTVFSTINILMIVFGAVFLYETMAKEGYISNIGDSIKQIHRAADVRFFLIAIGLTAFFEGVAGFGTPGAIVPLLLISMGYNPILSVVAVLLFDGIFAAFGAVGTPIIIGIGDTLNIKDPDLIATIAVKAAWLLMICGIIFFATAVFFYQRLQQQITFWKTTISLFLLSVIPFIIVAYFLPEYATIIAAFVVLSIAILVFTKGKLSAGLKAWFPYILLVLLLLLPKLFPSFRQWLNTPISWKQIFSTDINAALRPLASPLIPFVLIALLFTRKKGAASVSFALASKKTGNVALLLFPVIAVAQLMLASGGSQPSMINYISHSFANTGQAYVIIAPFIGVTGAFVTGSTTVSNIVFAASQQETAVVSGLDPSLILSLQLTGASIGNTICLFNIIAACAVANIKEPNKVLFKNLLPTIAATTVVALIAFMFL